MRRGQITRGGCVWIGKVERAFSLGERLRGLLGRDSLGPDAALLIERCGAIHTVGMRFAIDAVFLDRAWRVLQIVPDIPPGRLWVGGGWGAVRTLESEAGLLDFTGLQPGDTLVWKGPFEENHE